MDGFDGAARERGNHAGLPGNDAAINLDGLNRYPLLDGVDLNCGGSPSATPTARFLDAFLGVVLFGAAFRGVVLATVLAIRFGFTFLGDGRRQDLR